VRSYFGGRGAQIHARITGEGAPLILLPPAPHTGAYFDTIAQYLTGFEIMSVDYPGYGGSDRIETPSIRGYAAALSPYVPENAILVGFHTGNLVAAEIARRLSVKTIIMIDVPFFDAETRQSYASKLSDVGFPTSVEDTFSKAVAQRDESVSESRAFDLWTEGLRSGAYRLDAFRAAFDYDSVSGLLGLTCPVHLIATQSSLLEPTRLAAATMGVSLTERIDITAPVFEKHPQEMAAAIQDAIRGQV